MKLFHKTTTFVCQSKIYYQKNVKIEHDHNKSHQYIVELFFSLEQISNYKTFFLLLTKTNKVLN